MGNNDDGSGDSDDNDLGEPPAVEAVPPTVEVIEEDILPPETESGPTMADMMQEMQETRQFASNVVRTLRNMARENVALQRALLRAFANST